LGLTKSQPTEDNNKAREGRHSTNKGSSITPFAVLVGLFLFEVSVDYRKR
jgi:hypothetical protein